MAALLGAGIISACVPAYDGTLGGQLLNDRPPNAGEPADGGAVMPPVVPPTGDVPTWWGDVEPLVRAECHLCHGQPAFYGAPMPLVDYAHVMAPAYSDPSRPVHALVAERILPNTGKPPMPPRANGHLTDEEIDVIVRWSAAGAPEGERPITDKPDAGAPQVDAGTAPTPDAGHEPGPNPEEPYEYIDAVAPQAVIRGNTTDLYGCFRTVIQTDQPLHAVEIEPILDQLSVVHHILLFRDGGRNYPEQRTGFLCSADTVLQGDWELLHGWAPGGQKMVLPNEAGVRLENGDHVVVQIHYNNPTAQTVQDVSGMRFKVTRTLRPNDAAVLGVGTQNFTLPAGQSNVERSGTCALTQPMRVFSYSPHMHLLGTGGKIELIRGGQTTVLADVTDFAFESQVAYPAQWDLQPGDQLRTTCRWDTTTRNNTTRFGEGTTDEMCYMFIGHYRPFGAYSCGN